MLSSKIVDPHLLELFKQTWEKCCKEFSPAKRQDPSWKEPFELLSAALIYSYNGLINSPKSGLHSPIRSVCDWDSVWRSVLGGHRLPCFTSQDGQKLFATMHFASSSFRICTALYLISISERVRGSLAQFLKKDRSDWKRNELVCDLKKATSLGCCKKSETALTEKKMALAMIVAHRDEFGHGEKGQRPNNWAQKREQYFSKLYPCRIFQAQLLLVDLGLDELGLNC